MTRLLTIGVFMLLMFISCNKQVAINTSISLLPKPKSVVTSEANFVIQPDTKIIYTSKSTLVKDQAEYLRTLLNKNAGNDIRIENSDTANPVLKNTIYIIINAEVAGNKEAYQLDIENNTIKIIASNPLGIVHGIQTLRQLLPEESIQDKLWGLPCVSIKDEPAYGWRGVMLDPGRHFQDKKVVLKYIDLLSLYKMNVFHWHLTEDEGWRIEIKKYPELTEKAAKRHLGDGKYYHHYYTQEDVKEVVAYATKRGIMVIPEIDMPGHAGATMPVFPELHCTGYMKEIPNVWLKGEENQGRTFCVGNPKSLTFFKDVLDEITALFPAPYVHIGGDEAKKNFWESCKKCQNVIHSNHLKDEHQLQSWFMKQIANHLATKNKTPIGWDEIIEGGLIENAIVHSWRGPKGGIAATKTGHKVIMSYGPTYFNRHLKVSNLKNIFDYNPVKGVADSLQYLVVGAEACLWSEFIQDEEELDLQTFPKLFALSENLWNGRGQEKMDWDIFQKESKKQEEKLKRKGVAIGRGFTSDYKTSYPAVVVSDMARGYDFPRGVRYDLQNFRPNAAFDGDDQTICLVVGPKENECFTVKLEDTIYVNELSIVTGSRQNTYKWLYGVLEISEDGKKFNTIAQLDEGKAIAKVNKKIKAFRVRATKDQDIHNWIIVRDFNLK